MSAGAGAVTPSAPRGLARVADDNVKMFLGRMRIDLSLGGTEPMTGWWVASSTTR